MTTPEMSSVATARIGMINSLAILAIGLLPWPSDWETARDVVDSVRSPELNRAERDGHAGGYYEGLIGGREGADSSRGESSQRLIGNPNGWVPFKDADVVHYLDGEFLQFELKPSVQRTLFGKPFLTNDFGMHDDPVTVEKPDGTFRIAVVGSSIDMGWGVTYQDTYINQLEQWLNSHSILLGAVPPRRFEVLNFGVAAYSPMQRLEALRDKVLPFHPDLVIYSATTNDLRLMEIHLCEMLRKKIDLKYDFLREVVTQAAVDDDDLRVDSERELVNKARVKRKLHPFYWSLYDTTLGAIAAECRSVGLPLVMVIVPRVGRADQPPARAEPVARLKAIASHQGLNVFDLTDSFDPFDPSVIEIAVGDDHPNAIGHRRLFLALARALVKNEELYRLLFTGKEKPEPDQTAEACPEPADAGGESQRGAKREFPPAGKATASATTLKSSS